MNEKLKSTVQALRARREVVVAELVGLDLEYSFTGDSTTKQRVSNRLSQLARLDKKIQSVRHDFWAGQVVSARESA